MFNDFNLPQFQNQIRIILENLRNIPYFLGIKNIACLKK